MDGGSSAPNARCKYTDDVVGASAAQTDRRRRNAEGAEGNATETDRTAALTHRNAAPSHRNGAQTHKNMALTYRNAEPSHRNGAQTVRKTGPNHRNEAQTHRNGAQTKTTAFKQTETRALEAKPQRWREKRIKILSLQGLPLPPTIAGRGVQPAEPTWLGETRLNPPDPAFGLPPPVPPKRTRNF